MDFKFKNNTIYSYNKNSLNIENDNIDNKETIIESQINFLNNNNKYSNIDNNIDNKEPIIENQILFQIIIIN